MKPQRLRVAVTVELPNGRNLYPLKALLKVMWRRHRLKCVDLRELPSTTTPARPTGPAGDCTTPAPTLAGKGDQKGL